MQNKRILSLLIIALMITTLLVACGVQSSSGNEEKSTKTLLQEAFLSNVDVTTQEFKIDMSISLNGANVNDPEFDFVSNLVNNSRITLLGKTDTIAKKAEIKANVNVGGMSFEGKMYIDEKVIALNVPILGMMMGDPRLSTGYIVIDTEALMEEYGQGQVDVFTNEEEMVQLATRIIEMYLNILDDYMFVNNAQKEVTVGDTSLKATEIEISIGETEFKSIVTNTIQLLKDPEFADLLYDLVVISDQNITRTEFDSELNNMTIGIDESFDGDFDQAFEEMKEFIDFDRTNIKMNFYLDDQSSIVKTISDISFGFRDQDTTIDFGLNMEADSWNINKAMIIEIPELNETNSVDFYELLVMYLGSLYF